MASRNPRSWLENVVDDQVGEEDLHPSEASHGGSTAPRFGLSAGSVEGPGQVLQDENRSRFLTTSPNQHVLIDRDNRPRLTQDALRQIDASPAPGHPQIWSINPHRVGRPFAAHPPLATQDGLGNRPYRIGDYGPNGSLNYVDNLRDVLGESDPPQSRNPASSPSEQRFHRPLTDPDFDIGRQMGQDPVRSWQEWTNEGFPDQYSGPSTPSRAPNPPDFNLSPESPRMSHAPSTRYTPSNNMATFRGLSNPPMARRSTLQGRAPENTPAGSVQSSPNPRNLGQRYGGIGRVIEEEQPQEPQIDFHTLEYVGNVSENLTCGICHTPFVDPVDTPCNHSFCKTCLVEALKASESCPGCRGFVRTGGFTPLAHRIVTNQLDELIVTCPECQEPNARGMLKYHIEKRCGYTEVDCPGDDCDKRIIRKLAAEDTCLHYDVECPDCEKIMEKAVLQLHRERTCEERITTCELCQDEINKCSRDKHIEECANALIPCEWAPQGCVFTGPRFNMVNHGCKYEIIGKVCETLGKRITTLEEGREIDARRLRAQDRRVDELELERQHMHFDIPDIPDRPASPPNEDPASLEYMLTMVEGLGTRLNRVATTVGEIEARAQVMVLTETLALRDQIADIRNTQNVMGMHVEWLMRLKLREAQLQRGVNAAGQGNGGGVNRASGAGAAGGANGTQAPPRRLSDNQIQAPRL